MITGQITLQNFTVTAMRREGKKLVDGKPTDQTVPLKVLVIKDGNSGLQINAIFSPEDFDKLVKALSEETTIITATGLKLPFTRNGGIRG